MFQKISSQWKMYALALAVLCAAIFLTFWILRACYERRLQNQIWPAGAPEVSVLSGAPGGSIPTVMLLGDSRIAQWGLPQLAHWRVVNAGVGGSTTGQIRMLAPGLLAEVHPDAVVLEAGINDLKFLGLRPEMAPTIISLAMSNLVDVVNECTGHHCKVLVLETWPASRPSLARRLVWNATIPASVNQFNARIRMLDSPERGIRVVDLFSEAGLNPGPQSYQDTLHFTPETYARLTPLLEKELDAMLPPAK
jgi:lysophospholipase L1-like esterase